MKKLVTGIIIGCALTTTTSVFADSVKEYLLSKVTYPIVVNNKLYSNDQPILNYEGSTYVPLKAVGDMLGANVKWDNDRVLIDSVKATDDKPGTTTSGNTGIVTKNFASVQKYLPRYTPAVKLNGELYYINKSRGFTLITDEENNYYADLSFSDSALNEILAIAFNNYEVEPVSHPFAKGTIQAKQEYVEKEIKQDGINNSYYIGKIYNNDKSKTYEIITKDGEEKGAFNYKGNVYDLSKANGVFNLIPVHDLFDYFGIKCSIERDTKNNLLIFNFN
ncbi:stalk domain-containing protein [Paenibacillus chitinolyticus]|uniref:stalk domain-containing protein n=1 Tax=Paenibacillus chitinolyticus TaxID=79263 RepID=UPI001C43B668|nr:stalk domain-containing protein [Paenibacillus chitinolyticus]MBV6717295.1 copper amine oxidase N-terminal domain-containing protein [Paenibacillus chitinolyticus]